MNDNKIGIILPAKYPVPAVKGGAIETLVENFIEENEIHKKYNIVVYSYFNEDALEKSKNYKYTRFKFIKANTIYSKFNSLYRIIINKVIKKELNGFFINEVIKDLKENKIDKVIIEGNKSYVLQIKKYIKNIKIYLHIHSDAFNYDTKYNNRIANECEKIITVSNYIKDRTRLSIGNDDKIVTLLNCIDTIKFNKENYSDYRETMRKRYNIGFDEILILFSGRILEIKGIRELILAFKKYCLDTNSKLLIVGNAGFADNIQNEYDKELIEISREVEDKIIFTGYIHNDELPKFHSMSDIAVVPSIWDEPAGLVVIEAMASGIPLLVTDSGGIPEYTNDKCVIVVDRDQDLVEKIGKNLVKLINDEELRRDMGICAYKQGLKFNKTKYYNDFIEIINN